MLGEQSLLSLLIEFITGGGGTERKRERKGEKAAI